MSKNVTKAVVDAAMKVLYEVSTSTSIETDQKITQIVNAKGDVVISGNTLKQDSNTKLISAMKSVSSNNVQQKLAVKLSQAAKSVVSGLNLGQVSDAENEINSTINATTDLRTSITYVCSARALQEIDVNITSDKNVQLVGNVYEQSITAFQNCLGDSVSTNKAIQGIQATMDQTASAKSEGVNFAWIAVALIALIGIPVIGGGAAVLTLFFPLLSVSGAAVLAYYYSKREKECMLYGYARSPEAVCKASIDKQTVPKPSGTDDSEFIESLRKRCIDKNNDYGGFYYDRFSQKGYLYTNIPKSCADIYKNTTDYVLPHSAGDFRQPIIKIVPGDPSDTNKADFYINSKTGAVFKNKGGTWEQTASISDNFLSTSKILIRYGNRESFKVKIVDGKVSQNSKTLPSSYSAPANPGDCILWALDSSDPYTFFVFIAGSDKTFTYLKKIEGCGVRSNMPKGGSLSIFGLVRPKYTLSETYLYVGGALIAVGAIGFLSTLVFPKKTNSQNVERTK